jgi:tRNA dimethylallyltransferase
MFHKKTVIVIVGPTAVGKTSLAINLAKHYNTKIVSADSRQCFIETTIGVAKPSDNELQEVQHYFINSHSIKDEVNAGVYEKFALEQLQLIFENNDIAIVVGGTGLYIKALCDGLDQMPPIDKTIQLDIIKNYETNGLEWLQNEVEQKDNLYWQQGEQQNPQRLIRALAIKLSTNNSITQYQKNIKEDRYFNIIKIGLSIDKQELHNNIINRVDAMINQGLVQEVEQLLAYKHLNALQTVGYKEIFEHFEGKHSLQKAIELIKIHTRQYAKRQLTWFKKDESIKWVQNASIEDIIKTITKIQKTNL